MKAKIHPTYYPNASVKCNCGASVTVGATVEEIRVEVCSECHPFYTGRSNLVDTAGRVDKFKARTEKAQELKAEAAKKAAKSADEPAKQAPTSGKEALKALRKQVATE